VIGIELERALEMLGELLADRGSPFEVYAVGGGSLLLLGFIERPTKDLDLVAVVRDGVFFSATPLPVGLKEAAVEVAALVGIDGDWLNPGPADLLRFGLPRGYETRMVTRRFGGLTVQLAGRFDQSVSSSTRRSTRANAASTPRISDDCSQLETSS
jgi:hypothetical protein